MVDRLSKTDRNKQSQGETDVEAVSEDAENKPANVEQPENEREVSAEDNRNQSVDECDFSAEDPRAELVDINAEEPARGELENEREASAEDPRDEQLDPHDVSPDYLYDETVKVHKVDNDACADETSIDADRSECEDDEDEDGSVSLKNRARDLLEPGDELPSTEDGDTYIKGIYRTIKVLGSGGRGQVILAEHILLETRVALKILHPSNSQSTKDLERLRQEASICACLQHENLVRVRDFGTTSDGVAFIVMDYASGKSLKEILANHRSTLSNDRLLNILSQVARGLGYMHANGIMHRDIKPENILVSDDDLVKLIDFGIAKPEYEDGAVQALTQTGELLGSPYYMSPEQCKGGRRIDSRSDIYSLGCLIFEIVKGKPPLRGQTILKTLDMHINEQPSREGADAKDLNGALLRIALKCLEKRPEDRYQHASEILAEIESLKPPSKEVLRKRYAKIAMSGIAVLTLIVVSLTSFFAGKKSQEDFAETHGAPDHAVTQAFYQTDQALVLGQIGAASEAATLYEKALENPNMNDNTACNVGAQYCQFLMTRRDGWKKDTLAVYGKLENRLENLSKADKAVYKETGIGSAPLLYLYGAEGIFDEANLKPALVMLNKGIALAKKYPKSKWTISEFRFIRGLIYDLQNKPDDAIEDLEYCINEFSKIYGAGGPSIVNYRTGYGRTELATAYALLIHAYIAKNDKAKADVCAEELQSRKNLVPKNMRRSLLTPEEMREELIDRLCGRPRRHYNQQPPPPRPQQEQQLPPLKESSQLPPLEAQHSRQSSHLQEHKKQSLEPNEFRQHLEPTQQPMQSQQPARPRDIVD